MDKNPERTAFLAFRKKIWKEHSVANNHPTGTGTFKITGPTSQECEHLWSLLSVEEKASYGPKPVELPRWNRVPDIPSPGDWVCQWREVEREGAKLYYKPTIALLEGESLIFLHLQQHYDFIVYLGYSMWRKMLLMWELDEIAPTVPLKQNREIDDDDRRELELCGSRGWCGNMGVFNSLVPAKYLYAQRPLNLDWDEDDWTP